MNKRKRDLITREKIGTQITVGSWITTGHTNIAEIMASSDFDWLVIDMEHSSITLSEAQQLIQVIELSGVTPLVRVGENDANVIKRVMDAGAYGVIVPMVNSREEAHKAVEAVKYPPAGKRGVGLARAQGYGLAFDEYKKWVNKESMVIVQIEHIEAINNLEEILSVEGVDASMIGPYDLSGSIGYPGEFERKEVKESLKRYLTVCKKLKKPAGYHVIPPEAVQVKKVIAEGFQFIAFSLDTLFLGTHVKEQLTLIQKR